MKESVRISLDCNGEKKDVKESRVCTCVKLAKMTRLVGASRNGKIRALQGDKNGMNVPCCIENRREKKPRTR
ncbi:hypothetical protein AG1IA_07940 [Rhizoctonia solani AG-1 IA]|uniref:Uncharacterized protein n=1 Tax=Thanatephorus cucumeris (strain AG1-IA) TaxID=983506 RepID=L8WNU4_THACA|nr:hypothetical protein AG1IA_07940 [Rhizoctonia solani AG-1 IA]